MPSFIVAGPPRTGTTWLHEVLRHHTILPAPTKETRFFDLHFSRGVKWYLGHFPVSDDHRPVGEVAPTYFASEPARANIAATLPGVKLIFIFRDPVQRVISLYRLKRAYGMYTWSLEDALERDPELIVSSQYATHLRGWQQLFPSEQISINFFEDLNSNPGLFVHRLSDFLGVPRFELDDSQLRQVHSTAALGQPRSYLATRIALATGDWCKAHGFDTIVSAVRDSAVFRFLIGSGAPFPKTNTGTIGAVYSLLSREIEEMEDILHRDLSSWKMRAS